VALRQLNLLRLKKPTPHVKPIMNAWLAVGLRNEGLKGGSYAIYFSYDTASKAAFTKWRRCR